jgi:hypothetical protein
MILGFGAPRSLRRTRRNDSHSTQGTRVGMILRVLAGLLLYLQAAIAECLGVRSNLRSDLPLKGRSGPIAGTNEPASSVP